MTPTMPPADAFGFVKTLNNQGFMTDYLDEYSESFVEFASTCGATVLDVGAAYGVATLAALRAGATVIANDIDPGHLDILTRAAHETVCDSRRRLSTRLGSFPDDLPLESESLGAILICRVLHFFTGEQIDRAFFKASDWLRPGGRLFVVAETPYVRGAQAFVPTYEARQREGHAWPGFIEDFRSLDPVRGAELPKSMHLLDESVLSRAASNAGLNVLRAAKFGRPRFPDNLRLDGRESVGLVAEKA